ncbi:hypothetical protein PAT3040_02566, partial [Paenibacillus agaridevorans]
LLADIIEDKERNERGIKGYEAFSKYLTSDTMKSGFYKSLGIL